MARDYANGYVAKFRKRWRAYITWTDDDGNRGKLSRLTNVPCRPDKIDPETGEVKKSNNGKSTAEAILHAWRDELVAKECEGMSAPGCDRTVVEYVEGYIVDKEKSGNVTDVTTRGYRSHLNRLRGTGFGEMPMGDADARVVMAWEQELVEEGLSDTTVSHLHVFLKQVFTWARKVGDLQSSPFDLVDAPRRHTKPINALDHAEVERMESMLAGYGSAPMATGALIAVKTGMREGEVCALRWQNIDSKAGVIHVCHSLTRKRGSFELSRSKTAGSVRDIPFGPRLREVLLDRMRQTEKELAEFDMPWDDALYVIGSPIEAKFKNPQVLSKEWHQFARIGRLMGTQGKPPKFHDLRHTFATIAIAANMDVKTVSVLLGHADASMTLRVYADCLGESKRNCMNELDNIL